jgi:hypothetical protein
MLLRTLIALGLTAILRAQTEPPATDRPEYGGPSVLSRGMGASVLARQETVDLRPHIGINGICDTGLTAFTVKANGKLPNQVACGVEAQVGLSGFHKWRQSQLGLSYSGSYRHYAHNSYYDGTDQVLSLGFTHRLSKRLEFTFKESAGTFSRLYGDPTGFGFFDSTAFTTPNSIPLDNRVYYSQSAVDMTYRHSARLSFNFGGGYDTVQYHAGALYSSKAPSARADVAYRYSRFGTVGVAYEFTHIEFKNVFGASDLHNFSLIYGLRLSSTWELRAQVGATRVESLALQIVTVDPAITAITGQTAGIVAAYRLNYVPSGILSLTKRLPHGSLAFLYNRGVTPGNGIYLTSAQEMGSVSYGYTGIRKWSFFASVGYDRLSSLLQTIGQYRSYNAGMGVTRELGKGLNVDLRFDERRFDTGVAGYRRNGARGTLGLTWSPGGVPLIFW